MKHDDLTQYIANDRDDSDATLECYFHDYSGNLHHVYVSEKEIYNLLSNNVIAELEEEFNRHCRNEAKEHNLSLAIARYESKHFEV
jgi:hypothetical protein